MSIHPSDVVRTVLCALMVGAATLLVLVGLFAFAAP